MTNSTVQLSLLRTMLRIRQFEERVADLVIAGEIQTPCHLYIGQEAVAAGVCGALQTDDTVWGGHRSHGHYLAKGGDMAKMLAEIYCRRGGCSHGRGGSMHLFASDVGILGTVPLVAATIPLAVGAALASKLSGKDSIAVAFFGDGAVEEGHAHESMNLAALQKLPVIFVCENNFYASHLQLLQRRAKDNIVALGEAHGLSAARVEGNDVTAVHRAAAAAVAKARSGGGPTLLECRTFRWRGHVGPSWDTDVGVRRSDELKQWLPRDPIAQTKRELAEAGVPAEQLQSLEEEIQREVDAAVAFAHGSPEPSPDEVKNNVFNHTQQRSASHA